MREKGGEKEGVEEEGSSFQDTHALGSGEQLMSSCRRPPQSQEGARLGRGEQVIQVRASSPPSHH